MARTIGKVCLSQGGHALTDYAVLLVVILVILVGAAKLAGHGVHSLLSNVLNSFQQEPPND